MMVDELVTIKTFDEPMVAHLCQSYLDGHQIESFLDNEYLVGTYWLYSNAAGGVGLQVKSADAAKAIAILQEREASVGSFNSTSVGEVVLCCPDCDSVNVEEKSKSKGNSKLMVFVIVLLLLSIVFQTSLILAIPLIFWFMIIWALQQKKWTCKDCGYCWEGRKKPFGLWSN